MNIFGQIFNTCVVDSTIRVLCCFCVTPEIAKNCKMYRVCKSSNNNYFSKQSILSFILQILLLLLRKHVLFSFNPHILYYL